MALNFYFQFFTPIYYQRVIKIVGSKALGFKSKQGDNEQ